MNDKIIIDKESIKEFDKVKIFFLESFYIFDIDIINDVKFDATFKKRSGEYCVTDGFIELAPEVRKTLGTLIDDYYPDEERITECFYSRLIKGADINEIRFTSRKKELEFVLPCNPLTDCKGNVVEYSNCPSFTMSPHGNLRIYAGQSSDSPKREKLIYSDICKNWDRVIGKNYRPDFLDVAMNNLSIWEDGIAIGFDVFNMQCPVSDVGFFFKFCKIHSFNMYLGNYPFNTDFELARMVNGHIYVRFQDCGICFECGEISAYIVVD